MIDHDAALAFVRALTGSDVATFQTFDDCTQKRPELARVLHGPLDVVLPFLETAQTNGAGVFVTVNETNGRGRAKRDIIALRAAFVDKDDGLIDPAALRLPPSVRVLSSPKKEHAYWFLVPGEPLEDFQDLQKSLARHFHSDPAVHDVSRVMRLPGSWNLKNVPHQVRAWYGDPRRFRISEIYESYPRVRTAIATVRKPRTNRFESLVASLSCARENRNSLLYRAGLLARDLISAGQMSEDFAIHALGDACMANGLWQEEQEKTKNTLDRALHKDLEGKVQIDNEGFPLRGVGNIVNLLLEHPQWQGILAYDTRRGQALWRSPSPAALQDRTVPRALVDGDAIELASWLSCRYRVQVEKHVCADVLETVASLNSYDPISEYLHALKWDGTYRIGTWLSVYCGADDREIVRRMGACWLVAAVARAMAPGCRVDNVLVLEGPQGAKKTSLLQTLAGDANYDSLSTFNGKDALQKLRNPWIVELSELRAILESRIDEDAKDFISRRIDRYRPAYGRLDIEQPRRCVFAGTTNRSEYLSDTTGNRRYWPVTCRAIALDDVIRDRDQIWAEAVHWHNTGVPWWIDAGAEEEQERRETPEALEEAIEIALRNGVDGFAGLRIPKNASDISVHEVMSLVLRDSGEAKRGVQMRVAAILQKMGFEKYRTSGQRTWRYRRNAGSLRIAASDPGGSPVLTSKVRTRLGQG